MTTSSANIRTETTVRTVRGRRRPVVQSGPVLATCPVCGWTDRADAIEAGTCARCAAIARKIAKSN